MFHYAACHECLKPDSAAYIRVSWTIGWLAICPHHGLILTTRCEHCRAKLRIPSCRRGLVRSGLPLWDRPQGMCGAPMVGAEIVNSGRDLGTQFTIWAPVRGSRNTDTGRRAAAIDVSARAQYSTLVEYPWSAQ